jgi:DNA-binding transcriptional MerR regulator
MSNEPRYSLADLGRVAGVTPRTVRYYIAQGLLPGANDSGKGAWYDDQHLARLRLIRELQRQHLPLAEIRSRLTELSDDQVTSLLEAEAAKPAPPDSSALDYIRTILGTGSVTREPAPATPPAPQPAPAFLRRMSLAAPVASSALTVGAIEQLTPPAAEATPPATPPAPTPERSQWDRIALTNDIELHVRRPLSRRDNKRVERLITIARQVLGEEQP